MRFARRGSGPPDHCLIVDHQSEPRTSPPAGVTAAQKVIVNGRIVVCAEGDLLEVVGTSHLDSRLAHLLDGWQQKRYQQRKDSHND